MTPLETMRAFVASYPDADILSALAIDYTDQVPDMVRHLPAKAASHEERLHLPLHVFAADSGADNPLAESLARQDSLVRIALPRRRLAKEERAARVAPRLSTAD